MADIDDEVFNPLANQRRMFRTTSAQTTVTRAETPDYDVIVIGAGLAGLETAALLAHQSARVLVLERRLVTAGTYGAGAIRSRPDRKHIARSQDRS